MRHSFRFPTHIREAVKRHIADAVASVNPSRFKQESPYTSALANRIDGLAYRGNDGFVEFESTVVDDRGRGSAERWSGADLAITAKISDGRVAIYKAILIQAKLGALEDLRTNEFERLRGQVQDMKRLTRSPKVMEIATENGARVPRIISGNRVLNDQPYRSLRLGDFMVARVLTTLDGDTRPEFVNNVQNSSLTLLKVFAGLSR